MPLRGRGGTTGLLEYQGCEPTLAEGGQPPSNGMGVPFQCLGGSLSGPALGQKPQGLPPFPLPGHRRQNHPPAHARLIHLPSFEKLVHISHTHHHPSLFPR